MKYSRELVKSRLHNIPRFFFELKNTRSPKDIYLFFYFNLPYFFPLERFPSKITIELTNRCNFECVHCHRNTANRTREYGDMDLSLFEKIVSEISRQPGCILKIGGWGEPSLHPNFKKMMNECTKRGIRTFLFTNGTIFEKLSIQDMLSWKFTVIEISIDGFNSYSYSKIRRGGDFQKIRAGIKHLYLERNRSKQKFPKVVVQHVVFPGENAFQLTSFRKNWGFTTDTVDFCPYNPLVSDNEQQTQRRINIKRCKRIRRELSIFYDGAVPVCGPQIKHNQCEWVANIQNITISALWNSLRFSEIRKLLKKLELKALPPCRRCLYFR